MSNARELSLYEIDLSEITDWIQILIAKYQDRYLVRPKYVKIPQFVANAFESYYQTRYDMPDVQFGRFGVVEPPYLCGLIVCPTMSINSMAEIEVF